jgi:hypothetical protein
VTRVLVFLGQCGFRDSRLVSSPENEEVDQVVLPILKACLKLWLPECRAFCSTSGLPSIPGPPGSSKPYSQPQGLTPCLAHKCH